MMNPQIEQAARILEIKKAFDSSVAEMASAFSAAVSGNGITRVHVSGFIRKQAFGKQWSEHRTIWVDGFERGQWIRDGVILRRVTE